MKRNKKICLFTMVAVIIFLTVFFSSRISVSASNDSNDFDATYEKADEGNDVTSLLDSQLEVVARRQGDENEVLIAKAAKDVLSKKEVTYDTVDDLSRLVQLGYSCNQTSGPISITQASHTYKKLWWTVSEPVYVVCLSGTDSDAKNTTTRIWEDLLSGFEFDNKYVRNTKKAIMDNIPYDSKLIVTGHSLGGMVAQQVVSDKDIKNKYECINTVTFGSPLINGFKREGTVKRLGDTSDVVPYMSISTALNIVWQASGLNREDGGYKLDLNLTGAHCKSYNREDVWGKYDVCGFKNGNSNFIMDFSTTKFYASPVKVTD